MLELLSQLKSGVVKVSNMEKSIIFLPTIFIFKSSYSNYKTNLFRGLHHSSVVTAGSRDIDNDKLHNYIRGERTQKRLLHRDRLNKIFTFTIWSEGVATCAYSEKKILTSN